MTDTSLFDSKSASHIGRLAMVPTVIAYFAQIQFIWVGAREAKGGGL
jgi:hypothetical protein